MSTTGRARLVLIGPPAAGKTKIGKRVARALDAPFVDTDKAIVAEHGVIAEIFAEHGEAHFRALERVAVERALREPGAIVSLGGGAILDERTRADLAAHEVLLVTVQPEAVAERLTGGKRPLLADGGVEAWTALVAARRPYYEALATDTVDTTNEPIDEIAREVADRLARHGSLLPR